VAAAGSLARPLAMDIGEVAKTELINGEGGYHSSRVEKHRVHEIFSVGAAYTQVTASEGPEGHFNTLAIATVEDLNVLDIVKVERITARLVALHYAPDYEKDPEKFQQPWVIPLGSRIENLRVGGRAYEVQHPPGFLHDFDKPHSYEAWKENQQRYLTDGTTFEVPRFGKVRHCQLGSAPFQRPASKRTHQMRRLAMLTLDMGSPVHASIQFGLADIDGSPPHEDDL
jgi:hypothetical protein